MDSTNSSLATLSNIWSSVVDNLKATKDELGALKEEIKEICKNLTTNQGQLACKYDHLLNLLKGVKSTLHKHNQEISYYSCKVVSLENKKAEAIKVKFDVLEEHLGHQDDLISNLKDEVAFLHSIHCHCGELACVAALEVGELEYLDNEV